MSRKTTTEIFAALLALLFAYAAISKLLSFDIFSFQLGRAPYMGQFATWLAVLLPAGELLIVGLLLYSKTRFTGLWLSFIAMFIFSLYVGLMLLSGKHLPCTCGGLISRLSWSQHFIFNILFTLISLTGIIIYKKPTEQRTNNYDFSFHPH